jgi:hypothetical protein
VPADDSADSPAPDEFDLEQDEKNEFSEFELTFDTPQ